MYDIPVGSPLTMQHVVALFYIVIGQIYPRNFQRHSKNNTTTNTTRHNQE